MDIYTDIETEIPTRPDCWDYADIGFNFQQYDDAATALGVHCQHHHDDPDSLSRGQMYEIRSGIRDLRSRALT